MCISVFLSCPINWNLLGLQGGVMTPPTRCKFPIGLLNGNSSCIP